MKRRNEDAGGIMCIVDDRFPYVMFALLHVQHQLTGDSQVGLALISIPPLHRLWLHGYL